MLANSYPLHMTITMQERWLPNLRAEVQARRSGTSLPVPEEIAVTDPVIAIQQERLADKLLASGWYLHGSSLSLRYRAIGHEDPFLKVLLDIGASGVVSRRDTSPTHATLRDLFKQVASPFSAGRCTKCHSVESNPITGTHVNWRPYRRPLSEHRFTGFSHTPHVTLLREEACSKCHPFSEQQRDANSVFRPEFISSEWQPAMDAHRFTSDFEAISKANCAKCHSHDSGRDTCLTCHNYHVR